MKTNLVTLDGSPLSPFCFGAMQFGGKADRPTSDALYASARAAGINFFDTAYAYTGGTSETWLGEMVRAERDSVFVASKLASTGGSGAANIHAQFDESRRRHKLDCIDALYLHRWDAATPLEETFSTLAELKQDGAIRHIGVSNFAAWQVMKAVAVAARLDLRIDLLQPMYNLVKRQAEVELLPMAADQGISVAPYSPLGGGLLSGKYRAGGTGRIVDDPSYATRYSPDWMHATADALADEAADLGVSPATLAVAWVAKKPTIDYPIISARTVEQLEPSLAALSYRMGDDLYDRISALSPTPPPATDRLEEA